MYHVTEETPNQIIYGEYALSYSRAMIEWVNLKGYLVTTLMSRLPPQSAVDTLEIILERKEQFPIFSILAHVPVVGSRSTAAVERGVFAMNQTKTKHSSLMHQESNELHANYPKWT